MTMASRFLPHDRQFWWMHIGATGCSAVITLVTVLLWSPLRGQDGAAALVWVLPFTLAVLVFRWLYRTYGWKRCSMVRLIAVAVAYASVAAVLVTVSVAALTLPFFWDSLQAFHTARGMQLVASEYLLRSIASASLQAQVFLCAWVFMYISFTGQRDARDQELANAQLQTTLKDAQLRSLCNQLNPHFLFNALNDIRFMIHENGQHADTMLVGLAEILRYSLEGARREKVPLSEELEMIERYIGIVAVQLESRLRFSIEAPHYLRQCLVPPLMLQMLIENAIKHGVASMRDGGDVTVSVSEQGPNIRMVVVNDRPPASHGAAGSGLGLAVRNIEQRLQLLYGDAATHAATSCAIKHEVILTIPKEAA